MSMSESTRQKALDALDGMAEIVRREMLVRESYVDPDFVDPERSGAICQGHRYCAIGSLWAGAGIKVKRRGGRRFTEFVLPGVQEGERESFLRRRPGLRLAYRELNAAAERFSLLRPEYEREYFHDAAIEDLFESDYDVGRPELLKIIASAKRKVKTA